MPVTGLLYFYLLYWNPLGHSMPVTGLLYWNPLGHSMPVTGLLYLYLRINVSTTPDLKFQKP
jgi:hypothetical protein